MMARRRATRQAAPELSVDVRVKTVTITYGLPSEPPKLRIEGQLLNNPVLGAKSTMAFETLLRRQIGDAIQTTMSEEFADLVIESWTKARRNAKPSED